MDFHPTVIASSSPFLLHLSISLFPIPRRLDRTLATPHTSTLTTSPSVQLDSAPFYFISPSFPMYYGLAPSSLWYASTKPPFAPVVPNKSYRLLGGIPCSFGPTPVRKPLAGWGVRRGLDFLPFFVGLILSYPSFVLLPLLHMSL